MVSDEDLTNKLVELLDEADLTTTTTSLIRKQLEHVFGIDLRDKKAFVRAQVDLYLQTRHQQQEGVFEQDDEKAIKEGDVKNEADDYELENGERQEAEEEEDEEEELEEEEVVEEEDDEDQKINRKPEQDSRRLQAKIRRAKKESLQKKKKKRSGGGGFAKLCKLSPELQAFTGQEVLPRTQVVKFIWEYIRKKNLQDPGNKRKILCDDALRVVFGTDSTDMFKMNKLLTRHIWPLDDEAESKSKRLKVEEEGTTETEKANNKSGKRLKVEEDGTPESEKAKNKVNQKIESETHEKEVKKGKGGGFTAPLPLSEALVEFLGTGENELPRSEVVKRMWAYIKENNLQNPADKRQIKCDKKLQALLGCDTFTGFALTKHLASHFLKS